MGKKEKLIKRIKNARFDDEQILSLRGADLRNADLHDTCLRRSNLRKVKLRNADMHDTWMDSANLSDADLRGDGVDVHREVARLLLAVFQRHRPSPHRRVLTAKMKGGAL